MSLESLYKLSILVNMIDRVSGPAAKISSSVAGTVNKFQDYSRGMADMARDGVVLMGTGVQIADAAIAPVKATFQTQDALAELSSLGIEKLGALEDAASQFTNTWAGTSKAEFLTAAYDIKSGIASLSDEGVAGYTNVAGVTAKATKSTIAEMTNLFATGYGIYKDYYSNLSDLEFGEMFSGGISKSVQQFKTTGSGMAQAISALGGTATSANVPLEEQLTILGMLQATMSGSESGTKYTAFLNSAAKAGKDLGLNFTDANGQLKSMPEILGALQGKFGDVLTAADKLELQKAFGTVEAVKLIDLLYNKTDDLQGNILTLYDTMGQGMSVTEEMANKINAPPGQSWELLKQKIQATTETVGNAMLPTFVRLQERVSDVATVVADWVTKHPQLTSAVMYSVAAFGIFLTVLGAAKLGIGALGSTITIAKNGILFFKSAVEGVKYGMFQVKYAAFNLKTGLAPLGKAFLTAAGNVKTMLLGMFAWVKQGISAAISALPGLIASVWSFTAALLANPITWIVIAVIALVAAIILLWQNWDAVTAWMQNTWDNVCNAIGSAISWLRDKLGQIPDSFKIILAAIAPFIGIPLLIIEHWDAIRAFFANLPENLKQGFIALKQWFLDFFTGLGATFRQSGEKLLSTLADGVKATAMAPIEAVKGVFQKIRNMMPFSDAKEGPLSELTLSGRRVFETFDSGMQQSQNLPAQTAAAAFSGMDLNSQDLATQTAEAAFSEIDLNTDGENPEPDKTNAPFQPGESKNDNRIDKRTIIQQLIVNCRLDKIEELKKLEKLIQELTDGNNGDDPDPDPQPTF